MVCRLTRLRRLGLVTASLLALTMALVATPASAASWGPIVSKWSNKCVDERDQDHGNVGAHAQQWDCKNVSNQMYLPVLQGNGNYQLISERSGHCLAIDGGATYSGALAVLIDCVPDNTAQQWNRVRNPFGNASGSSWLVNGNSGKCLELPGWNGDNGLLLAQSDCIGGWKQYWNVNF
jgi:hypothetical protein